MVSLHVILAACLLVASGLGLQLKPSNRSAVLTHIGRFLSKPTEDIPHLIIMLRQQHLHRDMENPYTNWFMRKSLRPLSLLTFDEEAGKGRDRIELKQSDNRDSFVINTDMKELRTTSMRLVQKAGVFFFILHGVVDQKELFNILHWLWTEYSLYRNFILTQEAVLIYDPFHFDDERRAYGKVVNYDGKLSLERTLFSDMRGYPLRIQIFKSVYARPKLDKNTRKIQRVDGADGKVALMLQERMNFTMDLQEPDPDYFGERDKNGTYNGAIGSIIDNEIDMCLTGFFVKDYMVPEMVFTVAIYDDQLCIYVPKAKRIPQSILPIFSVSYNLWLGFILTAFVCATVWWAMRCLNLWLGVDNLSQQHLDKALKFQFMRIYIDTWVMWVRVNINSFPPFYSERIFIISLCLVSVIFGAIFESSLATVYIHPLYYNDINTLKELDESGLKVIYKYSSMADDLFFSETSPLFASLNKKLTHLENLNADVIRDIAEHGGKASVSRFSSLMMESLHFILSQRVWVVPECPKYYTISYVLPKDSPIEETVNNLLLRSLNGGLVGKWISEMQAEVDIKIMKQQLLPTVEVFKVLKIVDLQLAFYVVFFGSALGGVSLLAEVYLRRGRR